jgi:hypothetical protein
VAKFLYIGVKACHGKAKMINHIIQEQCKWCLLQTNWERGKDPSLKS